MSSIQVELSEHGLANIARVFGQERVEEVAQLFSQAAVDEWLGWLSGEMMELSSSTLVDRVTTLYEKVFPNIEPDDGFIYANFNVTFGRARYIAQVISSHRMPRLKRLALEGMIAQIERELEKRKVLTENQRNAQSEVILELTLRQEKLLATAMKSLSQDIRLRYKSEPSPISDSKIRSVGSRDLESIRTQLQTML
jgi:hypothetical protein